MPSRRAIEGLLAELREETDALAACVAPGPQDYVDYATPFVSGAHLVTLDALHALSDAIAGFGEEGGTASRAGFTAVAVRLDPASAWVLLVILDERSTAKRALAGIEAVRAELADLLRTPDDPGEPFGPPKPTLH